jgi:hypothetical protein
MKFSTSAFVLLILGLVLGLAPNAAQAQAARTWVSGVGDDANPCSRTAPCKTFAGAISKTAASGEINCLDPGGFGALTITQAITISCESGTAGVLVSGTNGFVVDVPAGTLVELKGLDIDGLGAVGSSLSGVTMSNGGNLAIVNCNIYGFAIGVSATGINGAHVTIENSIIRGNTVGISVAPQPAASITVVIDRTLVDSNPSGNLSVATGGVAVLSQSVIVGAPSAISVSGGSVVSYGNNVIRTGSPTSTLSLQ